MTDVLIVAGLLAVATPLWLLSPFVYLPVAGLLLLLVGVVREAGDRP